MAWPCISRVCCLARFWSQLDKSDLSVPLTIHNYSDIEEQEDGPPQRGGPPSRGSARPPAPARRPRDPAAGKPSGRRKGRAAAAGEPFAAETQYRQDFRAWPLPRRDAFPWVSASSGGGGGRDGAAPQPAPGRAACALPGGGGRTAIDGPEQLRPRSQADGGHTTSYSMTDYRCLFPETNSQTRVSPMDWSQTIQAYKDKTRLHYARRPFCSRDKLQGRL
ncbi:MAP6 domain-containing protein 1 isoform X2 [Pipra filicauda]|uniref:MAP6 domain-containing protein 1 isoform X2 n=1 Tax=Pipra filicauda TaxID=649802 RepID=A0A7R5KEP1_9PASS|nr:MAP6 domain-containing protein 1 isoform X2 [Pipra filicauda]